jgi:thioredoxin 1
MLSRRHLISTALLFALAFTGAAQAMEMKPFSPAALDAAKASGKPILVAVTAPWCPTCRAQKPILSQLTASPKFKEMSVFEIDFDTQKDVLRGLNVQMQSTLIAYKGRQEVGRSTGDTNRASIEALLSRAI